MTETPDDELTRLRAQRLVWITENVDRRRERDEARDCAIRLHQMLLGLQPSREVLEYAERTWPWLVVDQVAEQADGEQA